MIKRCLVTGAQGFIGSHLVKYLRNKGYWVRAVDIKTSKYFDADEVIEADLRDFNNCLKATNGIDEVYTLAADMGGMGYISKEHISSLHNSDLINIYMAKACAENKVKKVFFSSSACVYPNYKQIKLNSKNMKEVDVFPADPNEAYGWEKLISEIRYQEYEKAGFFKARIARFENCYGPETTYDGGREKAPAALCRKVALAKDGGEIEVWGDGRAQRSYMYIDDCLRGIYKVMQSSYSTPINLGSDAIISVDQLAQVVIDVSGKHLEIKHVDGPQGVRSRVISHKFARKNLSWYTEISLKYGIGQTYKWIERELCQNSR